MRRFNCSVLAAGLLLVGGCVSPAEQAAMDRQQCAGFGFAAGSDAMASCMMRIAQQRQAEQAAMQRQNAQNMAIQREMQQDRAAAQRARDEAAMQQERDRFMREFNSGGPTGAASAATMPSVTGANCVSVTGANAGSLTCR